MTEDKGDILSIKEEFELREKRLKLVYKILYVLVALWISIFVGLASADFDADLSPMYSFVLAVLSCYLISMVKYILRELSCMKISGESTAVEKIDAEKSFADIWRNCIITLAFGALLMLITMWLPDKVYLFCAALVFFLGCLYLTVVAFLDTIPENGKKLQRPSKERLKVLQTVGLLASVAVAYSLFSMFCWAAAN